MSGRIPPAEAALTVDGTGLLCVSLLLRLRRAIDGAAPGTVVHVIAADPTAPLDLPAWCHLTGHQYLGPVSGAARPVYALRLAADAHATRPDAPWQRAERWDAGRVSRPASQRRTISRYVRSPSPPGTAWPGSCRLSCEPCRR
ncbi:sulfurtransferase TusA family protein [Streptomyces sp. NPDC057257]|uniref:sulfurtransferase TusA family protein n=1 Tax=Streptomyces sp. NPDC057257 TaxID=3346071 RepID=UPI0036441A34